jgi:hypothetical protein
MKKYVWLLLTIFVLPAMAAGTYVGTDSTNATMRSRTVNIQCKQPEINRAAAYIVPAAVGVQLKCRDNDVPIGYTRTPLTTRTTSSQWLVNVVESDSNLYTKTYYPSLEYGSGQPELSLICAPINVTFQQGACTQ